MYVPVLASWVILWICNMIRFAFMRDLPPPMHVIAFSDLDHFLGRLLCSSGDVTRHCTTLMAEFRSNCNCQPLCVVLAHCVGRNYLLSPLVLEKDKVVGKKKTTMFLLFVLYVDNSSMATCGVVDHWVRLTVPHNGSNFSTVPQTTQENWANYHSEGASETNLTGPYKDSPRVA